MRGMTTAMIQIFHAIFALIWGLLFWHSTGGEPLATPDRWGPIVYNIDAEIWTGVLFSVHAWGMVRHQNLQICCTAIAALVYTAFAVLALWGRADDLVTVAVAIGGAAFLTVIAGASAWSKSQHGSGY